MILFGLSMFVFEMAFRVERRVSGQMHDWQAKQGAESEAQREVFKFPDNLRMYFMIACIKGRNNPAHNVCTLHRQPVRQIYAAPNKQGSI